jgi:hypothetical protein
VLCFDALEHSSTPQAAFSEFARVSTHKVIIEVPHRIGEGLNLAPSRRKWIRDHHLSKFTVKWIDRLARVYGWKVVKSKEISWYYIPNMLMPILRFPNIIRIYVAKIGNQEV